MTPAIRLLKQQKIAHEVLSYEHDPNARAFGLEAAEKLGLDPAHVFKTLVVELDGSELAIAIIPVAESLNMKAMAKVCRARKANMAERKDAERATGYIMGGISPLGQKKRLRTAIHNTAETLATIYVSGGKRGLDIALAPAALIEMLNADVAHLTRDD